jgi:ABC-2 type transport system permease protein
VFAVQTTMRLRAEETALHTEAILATSVGRVRWAASHLTIALFGTVALLIGAGLGAGLAHAVQVGDLSRAGPVLAGALVQSPAAWVLAGIVMALFGLEPRLVVGGWVGLVTFLLIGEFGSLFGLHRWVMNLSPFAHLPRIPGEELSARPLLSLVAFATVLITAGLVGFRRRDLG